MDKWLRSKWFVRLVSLAFAVLLYLFVYFEGTSLQSDMSRVPSVNNAVQVLDRVPVDIRIDSDRYVVSGVPEYVSLTLEGPNSVLIPAARQQNFTVFVDLRELEEGNHTVEIEYEKIPKDLRVYIEPKTISITIEERASAEFPVLIEYVNADKLPFGYEMGETTIEPDTVTITSSRTLIEQVAIVKVFVDVEGLTEPINKREVPINVYDSQGNGLNVRVQPERVLVSVNIDNPSKVVNVEIDTTGVLREDLEIVNLTVEPERVEVFAVSEILDSLESIKTEPLDLSTITSSGSMTVNLAPDENIGFTTEEVTITFEVVQTKVFEDLPIEIDFISVGQSVDIVNSSERVNTITITGEEEIIKNLTADDFRLYIDVSGLVEGEHVAPVLIEAPEEVSEEIEITIENEEVTIMISNNIPVY